MKNLIKKILKESNGDGDEITIAGVTFTIDNYISKDYDDKHNIFLNVNPEISYEKFLEIQSILKNVGVESEPNAYSTTRVAGTYTIISVHAIRINDLDLKPILKMYLETKLNTNSGTFFE